jgi:hypothetical protein
VRGGFVITVAELWDAYDAVRCNGRLPEDIRAGLDELRLSQPVAVRDLEYGFLCSVLTAIVHRGGADASTARHALHVVGGVA